VGSESVKSSLLKQNINEKLITVSGIPIRQEFEMPIDKISVYQKNHLSPNKKVITVLAGALGVLKNVKQMCLLLLNNPSYQIVVICGKNENLYESLMELALLFPESFHLFGYVEEIHELLAVSYCLITKPGGITLTEASALQVPLILYNPIPGQEAENAKHFEDNGAALVSRSLMETIAHVQRLSDNEKLVRSTMLMPPHSSLIMRLSKSNSQFQYFARRNENGYNFSHYYWLWIRGTLTY
jgi:processive 1,2-diacylglycerol beta-glucosyltransferase